MNILPKRTGIFLFSQTIIRGWHTFRGLTPQEIIFEKEKLMVKKQATVVQLQGITLAGKADTNHWVMVDGPENFSGSNAASTPKELLLIALGGCTASDVISIMKKKRVPFNRCIVHLTGTVRDEHPQIFTDIHIEYVVYGTGIKPTDVERAIELSMTNYCAVSAMLRTSVAITHSYRIETSPSPEPSTSK
jgi:putative redox protein